MTAGLLVGLGSALVPFAAARELNNCAPVYSTGYANTYNRNARVYAVPEHRGHDVRGDRRMPREDRGTAFFRSGERQSDRSYQMRQSMFR